MTIDKIPKVGTGIPVDQADRAAPANSGATGFKQLVGAAGAVEPGGMDATLELEKVVAETVERVRRGELDPSAALDRIIEGARPVVSAYVPADIDVEQALGYIRESLEHDPTFLNLLGGSGNLDG